MKKLFVKRASAVFLGISMLASSFASVYAVNSDTEDNVEITPLTSSSASFSDIEDEQYSWAQPHIIDMANKGYITGYEDGTFRPDNEVTRLECLALFSRAMGCGDEANEAILETAHEQYDSMIKNYTLSWGQDEIVYMLYKGALQKSDLDTYLEGTEKNKPMKRYEAAIIITKAMGGEKQALSDLGVTLSYSDAENIPSNSIQYVQYVTDRGIMNGMDDNAFSPETSVLRSQMAVMLSRTVSTASYSFAQVRITDVDTTTRQITVRNSDGDTQILVYNDNTNIKALGETIQAKDLISGVQAVITLSGNKLTDIDTLTAEPDSTVTGQYKSMSSTSGIIKLRVIPTGESSAQQYECTADVAITFNNSPATMRSFKDGDAVTLELVGGKVVSINGETKTVTISGATVESLDVDEDVTITISHGSSDYNGMTYPVADSVKVTKNSADTDLRSIYVGDTVTLTLEYGEIKKISATSKTTSVEGTIQAITISSSPSITVKVNGADKVYDVTSDVEITINGSEGKLSDFSVGDTVRVTTESNAVTKIVAESVKELSGTATGIITGVNSSYKVITIRRDNGETMQFQCPESGKQATTYITTAGTIKKLANIEADQSVEVKYTVSNGVYIATLVIILSE